MTKGFLAATERLPKQEQIPVVQFRKGQRKDEVMAGHLARFDKPEGVVLPGKAQEKTPVSGPGLMAPCSTPRRRKLVGCVVEAGQNSSTVAVTTPAGWDDGSLAGSAALLPKRPHKPGGRGLAEWLTDRL